MVNDKDHSAYVSLWSYATTPGSTKIDLKVYACEDCSKNWDINRASMAHALADTPCTFCGKVVKELTK